MNDDTDTRSRLAKAEQEIRKSRATREDRQREEDAQQRQRLERQSPSGARRSLVSMLNGTERERAGVASPSLDFMTKLREDQDLARRSPRFEKGSVEAGASYGSARLPEPSRAAKPGSNFDWRDGEPGNPYGSRFEWDQRFDPPRRVARVPDAAGRLNSNDARARDLWASGNVEAVDTGWMLAEAKRLLEAVRRKEYGRGRV